MIKSFTIPNKIYNIKLFRTGSIGVPGINSIEDITTVLLYLVDKLKYAFNTDNLVLLPINVKMINYKTHFIINNDQIINYTRLKNILNTNNSNILFMPITVQKDKNNCLNIRPIYYTSEGEKKHYLIEMFLSGKTNIKGLYPHDTMLSHLQLIEDYLNDEILEVVRKKYTNHDEILKLIAESNSLTIDYD